MLSENILVTGTTRLANDALNVLMGLIFVVCAIVFVYYMIRRSHSDEMDQKKWEKRAFVSLASLIFGELAVVLLKLVLSYYNIFIPQ